jgi:hypothetical protein
MTPLIISIALLAIGAVGVWHLIRRKQAEQLAEQKAREEGEQLAAERTLAHEQAMAELKAREDARLQVVDRRPAEEVPVHPILHEVLLTVGATLMHLSKIIGIGLIVKVSWTHREHHGKVTP